MTTAKFDEGNSYFVHRLHILDIDGNAKLVQDVAVVFTPGWVYVQESSSDGYVLPRERVRLVTAPLPTPPNPRTGSTSHAEDLNSYRR